MVKNYHYYLLDSVSETILGQFFAKTPRMADKIVNAFDFEKAHVNRDDCVLLVDPEFHRQFETYDELTNSDLMQDYSELLQQKSLELNEDDA